MATTSPAGSVLALRYWLRKTCSFPVFLAVLLLAGVFTCARMNPPEPDTWWHTAVGERILHEGAWPEVDSYSFTVSGTEWMAYEWLGEVVMAVAARAAGLQGQTALVITLAGLIFLLLYYWCYLRSGNVKAAFVACTLVLPLSGLFFVLRPQLLGYVLLLLMLICLERFRLGHSGAVWLLPPLFWVWVNTHGTFAFGLAIWTLYWLSGFLKFRLGGVEAVSWTPLQRRNLALAYLCSVLLLPLTPYGTRLAAYPLQMALFQPVNIASIREWQPLGPDLLMGKLFLGLLLLFFLAQVLFRMQYRLEDLGLLLFAVYAAASHRRFLFFFLLIFAPLLAALMARWSPPYQPQKDHPVLNFALLAVMVFGMASFFPSADALRQTVLRNYPEKAVAYLQQNPVPGPMFNEYGWGGYLIWSRSPHSRVFIDGRADIYEHGGVLKDYMSISLLEPDTQALLRKYGVNSCLIQLHAPLGTLLAGLPDWQRAYADDVSVLYVRKEPRPVDASLLSQRLSPDHKSPHPPGPLVTIQ